MSKDAGLEKILRELRFESKKTKIRGGVLREKAAPSSATGKGSGGSCILAPA